MLGYAWIFLVIALVAAVFGFGGIAGRRGGYCKDIVLRISGGIRAQSLDGSQNSRVMCSTRVAENGGARTSSPRRWHF